MLSFQIHSASNRFSSSGTVRMRGLLNPINHGDASTVGNPGHASSYFPQRAERGLRRVIYGRFPFVSVRQGLRENEGSAASQHPVQSLPVPIQSVPVQLTSRAARQLRKRVERNPEDTLRAFAFSFIVIRNKMRGLASVLLLRQSQPPLASQDEGSRLVRLFHQFPLVHLRQKPASGIPVSLCALSFVAPVHGSNHRTGVRQGAEKRSHELVIQGQEHV